MTYGTISRRQHTGTWNLKLRGEHGEKHFHKEVLAPNFPSLMKTPKFLSLRSSMNPNKITHRKPHLSRSQ